MRAIVLVLGLAVAGAAAAQEAAAPDPAGAGDEFRETQALIDRMQARIDAINTASSTRDKEIEYLNEQISRAIQMIASGREDNQNLLQTNVDIEDELRALFVAREDLTARLTEANEGRETVVADLNTKIAALSDLLDLERKSSAELGANVARLTENLEASRADGEASERELAQSHETLASAMDLAQERQTTIEELMRGARESENKIASLTRAAQELRRALADARSGASDKTVQLALLRQDLDAALADSARGLSQYRSEFFGRLRDALGDHPDIRTVGDRFVFQSEVLFESGSADLDSAGRQTLDKLADTLMQVTNTIPADVRWILRVDGHTDRVPIRNFRFESNWELSTARSVSVVKHLIDRGLPPGKLAATGFGEYRPMDPREDEIAYRRNRRIEFMLTSR
jgi:chemotaxis protein MotB